MKRNRKSATQSLGDRVWQKSGDDDALIKYLLGELSDQDRDRIEDKYFADDAFHERLLILEEELTDSYVRGELSPEQRQHFEEWFLRSPERRERLEFSRAVVEYASRTRIPPVERPSLWSSILSFLPASRGGQFALACAMLALIVIPAAIWQQAKHRTEVERQSAIYKKKEEVRPQEAANFPKQPNSERQVPHPETPKPKLPAVFAFALTNVVRGGDSEANIVRLPLEPTRIQLKVEVEANDYHNYRASIQTPEGKSIQNAPTRGVTAHSPAGATVLVNLPSTALPPGDYILRLRGVSRDGTDEEIAAYSFKVRLSP